MARRWHESKHINIHHRFTHILHYSIYPKSFARSYFSIHIIRLKRMFAYSRIIHTVLLSRCTRNISHIQYIFETLKDCY